MKQIPLLIVIIFTICSCTRKEKTVNGILNPNVKSFIDFQTADDIEINNFIKRIDSLAIKSNDSELKSSSKFYHSLLKFKLIKTPSIHLKLKKNSEIQVFINKTQYQKIKQYNYLGSNLDYIVNIKLKYKKMAEHIFLSDSIIEVKINKLKK